MERNNSSGNTLTTSVELLTTVQVAALVGVHRITVWHWWNDGDLSAAIVLPGKLRKQPLFSREEVDRFVAKRLTA